MTEDRCEQLLEQLESQSFALRQRADRLQMLSAMAAQTSEICRETDAMIDNYVDETSDQLKQCLEQIFSDPKHQKRQCAKKMRNQSQNNQKRNNKIRGAQF